MHNCEIMFSQRTHKHYTKKCKICIKFFSKNFVQAILIVSFANDMSFQREGEKHAQTRSKKRPLNQN